MENIEIPVIDFVFMLMSWGGILFSTGLGLMLCFHQEKNRWEDRILGAILLIASLFLASRLVYTLGLTRQFWTLYVLPLKFILSIPPMVFFYFMFRTKPSRGFRREDVWHFVLPAIQAVFYLVVGCSSLALKSRLWHSGLLSKVYLIEDILFSASIIFYGLKSVKLLRGSAGQIKVNKLSLRWPSSLLVALLIVLLIHIVFMAMHILGIGQFWSLGYVNFFLELGVLLFVSTSVMSVYFPITPRRISKSMNNTTKKETLAREEHWFCQRTEELFKKDRVFLNPDLDLATLSKAYGISKRQLSVFTKTVFAKNVNELINFYRMNYVLQCLEEGQYDQYNILSIGFSAGFSSKSTFYRVFKKAMDHTPSEYIEQLQQKS